jgi:U3 small nucleolar RNA-associated protein 4
MKYNRSRNKLAIGTEEGFVCIFDVTSDGLSFAKILDKQEGRVLSLDWHHDGFHIVTGSTGQRMFLLLFTNYIHT